MSSYVSGPPRDQSDYRQSEPRQDDQYSTRDRYPSSHAPRHYYDDDEEEARGERYAPPSRYDDRDYEPSERSYAPGRQRRSLDEPYSDRDRQLTRYDDEKAYAGWRRGEDERDADYRRSRSRGGYYDDDERTVSSRRHRHYDDDDRDRGFDDREYGKHKDGKHHDLVPTLAGGAVGGFLGHEFIGKGPMGTIGGAVVGALAARGFEHHEEKKHREREEEEERRHRRREYDNAY